MKLQPEILKTFLGKNTRVPFWFMRQAGRHLPEYRKIRESSTSFLDLCLDVDKAREITLQPIRRYNVDGVIIFSDILILPFLLGWDVKFVEKLGPILSKFTNMNDFTKLRANFSENFDKIFQLIRELKEKKSADQSLIGFIGSPWTVATYLIEGSGGTNLSGIKRMAFERNQSFENLLKYLTEQSIKYLCKQIENGVEIVQIFESTAQTIYGDVFDKYVIEPTKQIVDVVRRRYPKVPIICFPRNIGFFYEKYAFEVAPDGLGVDYLLPFDKIRRLQKNFVIQGNLDPMTLLSTKKVIKESVNRIFENIHKKNFIFNLGGGVLPNTPVENMSFLVELVKDRVIVE